VWSMSVSYMGKEGMSAVQLQNKTEKTISNFNAVTMIHSEHFHGVANFMKRLALSFSIFCVLAVC